MSYVIKIKNDSGSTQVWAGKEFTDQEEYTVPTDNNRVKYQTNSSLLSSIGTGDALVGDGNEYFTDVNQAIDHLKGNLPSSVELNKPANLSGVKEANGMRARLIGVFNQTVTKNTTTNLDWLGAQLQYNGVNKPAYFDGIEYYAENAVIGDKATFQVVDKDGVGVTLGWYDQATFDAMGNLYVVEEFGKDWAMAPNSLNHLSLYKAAVIPGLYMRLKYTSTGTVDNVNLIVNLFRHLDGR